MFFCYSSGRTPFAKYPYNYNKCEKSGILILHSKDLLLSKRVGACPLEKTIFKKSSGITSTRNSNYFKIEWYRPPLRRLKARRSFRTPGFYLTVKTIFTLQAQSSLWCLLFLPSGCRKARHKVSEKVHLSRCCL